MGLAFEEAQKKAKSSKRQLSISERELTAEEQKYYDKLQEAKKLKEAGAAESYIFAKTGWVPMNSKWSYGFENTLPNGDSADIILEKDNEGKENENGNRSENRKAEDRQGFLARVSKSARRGKQVGRVAYAYAQASAINKSYTAEAAKRELRGQGLLHSAGANCIGSHTEQNRCV